MSATSPARPPRLVVLDGHTCNPGDLSWEPLERLGHLTVHPRTAPDQVAERIAGADVVLTNKTPLNAAALAGAPTLRGIAVLATGYDVVDLAAARHTGVPVCNVPEYGTASVAQAVFALLLELCLHTGDHARAVREGRWSDSPDFCFWDGSLTELAGRTIGVVGLGRIGRAVARIGLAFGMAVAVLDCNRVPAQLTAVARRWLGTPALNFFDDFRIHSLARDALDSDIHSGRMPNV